MWIFSHNKDEPKAEVFGFMKRDIHSHLLPGLDDGSPDVKTSLELIRELYSFGLKEFICTPHIFGDMYKNSSQTILPALEILQKSVKEEFPDIKLAAAAEYMLDDYFLELLHSKETLLTLNGNLLLTELPFSIPPSNIEQLTFEMLNAGYQPILAHPERYGYYYKNLKMYSWLKEVGFLMQMNLLSLTNYYGSRPKKVARFLLKENMIDFVGTDLHHLNHLNALTAKKAQRIFKKYLNDRKYNLFAGEE